jgi:hypothetical protein
MQIFKVVANRQCECGVKRSSNGRAWGKMNMKEFSADDEKLR